MRSEPTSFVTRLSRWRQWGRRTTCRLGHSITEEFAFPLRTGRPAILPRVVEGHCLVDLRCVLEADDIRI